MISFNVLTQLAKWRKITIPSTHWTEPMSKKHLSIMDIQTQTHFKDILWGVCKRSSENDNNNLNKQELPQDKICPWALQDNGLINKQSQHWLDNWTTATEQEFQAQNSKLRMIQLIKERKNLASLPAQNSGQNNPQCHQKCNIQVWVCDIKSLRLSLSNTRFINPKDVFQRDISKKRMTGVMHHAKS